MTLRRALLFTAFGFAFAAVFFDGFGSVEGDLRDSVTADVHGSLVKSFHSVSELAIAADSVVVATIVDSEQRPYGHLPFTLVTARVDEHVRGERTAATIRVFQTGGTLIPLRDGSLRPGNARFEGVPVMAVGETYLLFVYRSTDPEVANAYEVLGEFQGKFKFQNDRVVYTGQPSRLSTSEFATQRWAEGRSRGEVILAAR